MSAKKIGIIQNVAKGILVTLKRRKSFSESNFTKFYSNDSWTQYIIEKGVISSSQICNVHVRPLKDGEITAIETDPPQISHANRYVGQVGDPWSKAHEISPLAKRPSQQPIFRAQTW